MNNISLSTRQRVLRAIHAQILLSLLLGVTVWLCLYRIFLAQAADPPTPTTTLPYAAYLPIIQTKHDPPGPNRLTLDWDPQLTERGAHLVEAQVTAGEGYWRLRKAEWLDEKESAGRHHILVDVLDSTGQRSVTIPITVAWKDGSTQVFTELKPGEPYSANYAMYDVAPSYGAQPDTGAPADRVEGMGLGSIELPKWKIHTSYGFVWQWTIADSPALTVTPTVTTTPTPTTTADIVISPTLPVTSTVTPTPTIIVTLTPVATIPAVATIPSIATLPPVATPTPTATTPPTTIPTPTTTPGAQGVVVGCQPNNGGSRFEGYIYRNGQLVNGDRVVFSYAADGPWVTQPAVAGNGQPGFYAHIISVGVARAGDWYAWLVDQKGERISTMAAFTTNGVGGTCNIASINFIY